MNFIIRACRPVCYPLPMLIRSKNDTDMPACKYLSMSRKRVVSSIRYTSLRFYPIIVFWNFLFADTIKYYVLLG